MCFTCVLSVRFGMKSDCTRGKYCMENLFRNKNSAIRMNL